VETYDIVMLVVLVGATLFGAVKGFAWQLASIASIVVSYLVAYHFREPFSQSIHADPPWNRFLAMLILYVGTSLVIWVAFRMVSGSIDRLKLKEFDRQIGALFGLAKGALYCSLITLFAVTLLGDQIREKIVVSKSGRYIADVLNKSEAIIPPEIQEVVDPYLKRFDERFHNTASTSENGSSPWGQTASGSTRWGQSGGSTPWGQSTSNSSPWGASQPANPGSNRTLRETAADVTFNARNQLQNRIQNEVQTQVQNWGQNGSSVPWQSGQSTPWQQPSTSGFPQQATQPIKPWGTQQR
jgi:membrane protein required for colicin V production